MSKSLLERKLSDLTDRLRALREEIAVAEEQRRALAEEADDLRIRALVSETPLAEREHTEADRHASAMAGHLAALRAELERLERAQDELLDRLIAESR